MASRMKFGTSIMIGVLALLISGTVGWAETGSSDPTVIRQELDAVKAGLETVKAQLGAIQQQLAQRQAPAGPVAMTVGDGPTLGSAEAPIVIVEFSDCQCPFCKKHVTNTLGTIKTNYIDTGKVRYMFRDFPLDSIHPYARKAAEAAHCAGDQGKFWDMHDTMFQNQGSLMPDNLKGFANEIQLDLEAFSSCLDEGKYAKKIEADVAAGSVIGVMGTPKFFIGKLKPDGSMVATVLKGAQPATAFGQVIDRLLGEQTP